MKVLGISGSLRKGSYNTTLLNAAAGLLPEGTQFERYEGLGQLPPYNEDHDTGSQPEAVRDLRERIAEADAVLFVTPEYNGSIPGQLKNAVDWASRPRGEAALANKPVAVIGASASPYGALWAQQDLRKALGIAGARVLEEGVAVGPAQEKLSAQNGRLLDVDLERQLLDVLGNLIESAQPASAVS